MSWKFNPSQHGIMKQQQGNLVSPFLLLSSDSQGQGLCHIADYV
jgi:hypothetical protein